MDPGACLRQEFEHADVDRLRQMVVHFTNALMSADVGASPRRCTI